MSDKIRIKHAGDGGELEGCYFSPAGTNSFDFYDKDNPTNPLVKGITNGSIFGFHLMEDPTVPWKIYVSHIDDEKGHGAWAAGELSSGGTGLDQTSGSFQADAGGAFEPEDAAASAGA